MTPLPSVGRDDPLFPNAGLVARREYGERVRSRLFVLSTLLLATLAVLLALLPFFTRAIAQPRTSPIGIVTQDDGLAQQAISVLGLFLNRDAEPDKPLPFSFERIPSPAGATDMVADGRLDAALVTTRGADGGLDFVFLTGETIGQEQVQVVEIAGTFAVAILDWTANNAREGANPFRPPEVSTLAAAGPTAGGAPISPAEFASRRVVGVVLVVLIFLTVIIYGMWVAAGVVTEKATRVMELMISAASPRQLVVGKILGIGAAGLTQAGWILIPALVVIAIEDPLATAVLGPGPSVAPSLAGLSVGLLAAFLAYFVLGFVLYALIYAAAASMVSRAEDLQMLALPLSLIAIVGYVQAVLALAGGGGSGFLRTASYVPFWSPFVMLTRLTVGRVQPWEVVLSLGLLVVTIGVTYVAAVRIYAAGVLLYGQRPGFRAIAAAALGR